MKNKQRARFLSVKAVAEELDYEVSTIRTWVSERRIPHVRAGRVIRIPADALDKFIREHTIPAAER